jgi:hypothetical protein
MELKAALIAVPVAALLWAPGLALGQTADRPARTSDSKPNLNGIWQAVNTANWNLETHGPLPGPPNLGAIGAIPPGLGVVEGGAIPYRPEALAKQKENFANRWTADPEIKCYLPGVPRATYLPYPFQIVQGAASIMIAYEFAGAVRPINMGKPREAQVDTWMGWSNGRWEGDTLVIDVTGLNNETWFDRSGNYHSDALHVVERYTPSGPNVLSYEAAIDDPQIFSRPWKISMPLYRRLEKDAQLMEFKCAELVEELLYGPLRKHPGK